jgi:hypothetical protein
MKVNTLFVFLALLLISACKTSVKPITANEPTIKDYVVGEQWEYTWKTTAGEKIRGEGITSKEVVAYKNGLGFSFGNDTIQITNPSSEKSNTPYRDWPLEIGKKWRYESETTNNEGDKITIKQDAEVISYGDVTVKGGTFKAFKIVYTGTIRNHKFSETGGLSNDVWWYAPTLKSYVKHTQDNGDISSYSYVKEVSMYVKP